MFEFIRKVVSKNYAVRTNRGVVFACITQNLKPSYGKSASFASSYYQNTYLYLLCNLKPYEDIFQHPHPIFKPQRYVAKPIYT